MKEINEVLEQLKVQITNLEDRIKKGSEYANQIAASIEKLAQDKITTVSESHFLAGAKEAYVGMVKFFESKFNLGSDKADAKDAEVIEVKAEEVKED